MKVEGRVKIEDWNEPMGSIMKLDDFMEGRRRAGEDLDSLATLYFLINLTLCSIDFIPYNHSHSHSQSLYLYLYLYHTSLSLS